MNLERKLTAIKDGVLKMVSPETFAVMNKATESLRASGIMDDVIEAGVHLPHFELTNAHGVIVKSAELLRTGPVVISFFRGHWCPYCVAELCALQEIVTPLRNLGATLVAVSPQLHDFSLSLIDKYKFNFDIVRDTRNAYAETLGLRFSLPAELRAIYRGFGIDLASANGEDSGTLPIPARIVVDSSGIVRVVDADPDYTVRPEPRKTLDDVKILLGSVLCSG